MPTPELVQNNVENNGKMLGGITGKGWLPKQSGNPGGRPKKHITDALRDELDANPERARAIALKLLEQAQAGDVASFDRVADRVEGKPAQSVNLNGDIDITVTDRRIRVAEVLSRLAGETER